MKEQMEGAGGVPIFIFNLRPSITYKGNPVSDLETSLSRHCLPVFICNFIQSRGFCSAPSIQGLMAHDSCFALLHHYSVNASCFCRDVTLFLQTTCCRTPKKGWAPHSLCTKKKTTCCPQKRRVVKKCGSPSWNPLGPSQFTPSSRFW